MINNSILYVEEAPEPNDIAWNNQKYTTKMKISRRLICIICTIILLIFCVFLIGSIKYTQSILLKKNASQNSLLIQILSICIGVLITFMNKFFFGYFINKIVRFFKKKCFIEKIKNKIFL